jgi:hypothetical protein
LENLEKIRHTNGLGLTTLPVDNNKSIPVTSIEGKSSKNPKYSNMRCYYCDNNNHNTADCRAIAKFKQQKRLALKPSPEPERSIWPSFYLSKKLMNSKGN